MKSTPALSGLLLALRTVATPGLAGVAIWAVIARPLPRHAAPAAALAGLLLGWALGFGPQAAFPPAQTLDWLPWLLVALALAGTVPRGQFPATIGVLLAGLAVLTPPLLAEGETTTLILESGAAALLGLALMAALDRSTTPARGAFALAAGLGGLGLVTTLGGSIVIGGLADSAFAVAAALWLAGLGGRMMAGTGLLRAGAVVWLWLAYSARHLAGIPLPETLLAAAALATARLPAPGPEARGLRRLAGEVLPPAIPALAAVALAAWGYFAAQQGGYY
jgi:hypothetical protein